MSSIKENYYFLGTLSISVIESQQLIQNIKSIKNISLHTPYCDLVLLVVFPAPAVYVQALWAVYGPNRV
jgi:hypothetical protein